MARKALPLKKDGDQNDTEHLSYSPFAGLSELLEKAPENESETPEQTAEELRDEAGKVLSHPDRGREIPKTKPRDIIDETDQKPSMSNEEAAQRLYQGLGLSGMEKGDSEILPKEQRINLSEGVAFSELEDADTLSELLHLIDRCIKNGYLKPVQYNKTTYGVMVSEECRWSPEFAEEYAEEINEKLNGFYGKLNQPPENPKGYTLLPEGVEFGGHIYKSKKEFEAHIAHELEEAALLGIRRDLSSEIELFEQASEEMRILHDHSITYNREAFEKRLSKLAPDRKAELRRIFNERLEGKLTKDACNRAFHRIEVAKNFKGLHEAMHELVSLNLLERLGKNYEILKNAPKQDLLEEVIAEYKRKAYKIFSSRKSK
jgi:hypothetical protein